MSTEILLFFLLLAQVGYSVYRDWLDTQEKKKLINALMSKTPEQALAFEATDKLKSGETVPVAPDFTSLDEVSQDEWEKLVLKDEK